MAATWSCALCRTANLSNALLCNFCAAPSPLQSSIPAANRALPRSSPSAAPGVSSLPSRLEWKCKACFLLNPFRIDRCDACRNPRFGVQNRKSARSITSSHMDEGSPPAKKKINRIPVEDEWSCRFCTFSNLESTNHCMCCETPKQAYSPKSPSSTLLSPDSGTSANPMVITIDDDHLGHGTDSQSSQRSSENAVTLISSESEFNDALRGAVVQCEACGCEFSVEDMESLKEHAALHISGSSAHFSVTRDSGPRNTTSSSSDAILTSSSIGDLRFTTAYEAQYARSFQQAFAKSKSPKQIHNHLKTMSMRLLLESDTETMGEGVMDALLEHYQNFPQIRRNFVLASKVSHFWSGFGDRGWGCGYRNIQTMCSSLMELPHFRSLLFGGVGYIPSIPVLQQSLEAAWAEGFDPGSKEKLTGVYGGNKWIGTYDAVAMLRHFGVPMELQTFSARRRPSNGSNSDSRGSKGSNGDHSSSSSNVVSIQSFKYRRFQQATCVPHTEMFKWVWNYFEKCKSRGDKIILPLYLQHDGHSRTIVGAENSNGRIALLLFDPSFPSTNVIQELQAKGAVPDLLRKTLSEFRHQDYQIAFLKDPSFVITHAMRSNWKKITQQRLVTS